MSICDNTDLVSTLNRDIEDSMYADQSEVTWYFTTFESTLINEYIIFSELFVLKLVCASLFESIHFVLPSFLSSHLASL